MTPARPEKAIDHDNLVTKHPLKPVQVTAADEAEQTGATITVGDGSTITAGDDSTIVTGDGSTVTTGADSTIMFEGGKPITINLTESFRKSLQDGVKDVRDGADEGRENGGGRLLRNRDLDDKDGDKDTKPDPVKALDGKVNVQPDDGKTVDGKPVDGQPGDGTPDLFLVDDDTILWEVDGVTVELTLNFDNLPKTGGGDLEQEIVLNISYPEAGEAGPGVPPGGTGARGISDLDGIGADTGTDDITLAGVQNSGSDAFIF